MNKEEIKKELIKFANYLNKYATLEYVRFDFMVIDYLQTIEEPEEKCKCMECREYYPKSQCIEYNKYMCKTCYDE